jgi:hypothetical protein
MDSNEGVESQMAAMINIIGPNEGKYIVAFTTEDGRSIGLVVSEAHADVLCDIQEKIPYGLVVPDVTDALLIDSCGAAKTGSKN